MGSSSIALDIARMVTEFLGPHFPRLPAGTNATLNALRTRLETGTAVYDNNREKLAWEVREAIRTEFFKIIYPTPPTQLLLNLVTRTELLLTNFPPKAKPLFFPHRPFYFPGARVAVPTEAGSRRAGTTLQLRFKEVNNTVVTESLLHLDGPSGGSFQWVQTQALTPLVHYQAPVPAPIRRPVKLPVMPGRAIAPRGRQRPPAPRAIPRPSRIRSTTRTATRVTSVPVTRRKPSIVPKASSASGTEVVTNNAQPLTATLPTVPSTELRKTPPPQKPVKVELPRPPSPPQGPAMLPPTFVPESIISTSPPPRKRIRGDSELPVSHTSGTMRRTLDITDDGRSSDQAFIMSTGRVKKLIGIDRIVARRMVKSSSEIEYFVKWCGRSMKDGSWERRESLLADVPGLVMDFDTRHPNEPKQVYRSDRVRTEAEATMEVRNQSISGKEDTQQANEEPSDERTADVDENKEAQASQADKMDIVTPLKSEKPLELTLSNFDSTAKYIDELTGLPIPAYVDTPILEIPFSGMVLQIRRPDEYTLHNDWTSVARDVRRRQLRLKQENILLGEKLFHLSKTEAKAVLDTGLRVHKAYNQYPTYFPRGVGRVVPSDTGVPFTKEMLDAAPPSWESYFHSVGFRPKHFERDLPPYMPTLDSRGEQNLAVVAQDLSLERAIEHRERARTVVRAAFRYGNSCAPPTALFRDGRRRAEVECHGEERKLNKVTMPSRSPSAVQESRTRGRNAAIAAALSTVKKVSSDSSERWYDPIWSCWRTRPSPTTG